MTIALIIIAAFNLAWIIAFFVMRADRNEWRTLAQDGSDIILALTDKLQMAQAYVETMEEQHNADLATIEAYEHMDPTHPSYIPPVNGLGEIHS